MCADIGHCDSGRNVVLGFGHVGVMCADIGHCDIAIYVKTRAVTIVGVMCADIGHCDEFEDEAVSDFFYCRSHVC